MSVFIKHLLTRDSASVQRGFNETFFPWLSVAWICLRFIESAIGLFNEVFNEVITRYNEVIRGLNEV